MTIIDTDRRVTPEAIERLGNVILRKLRATDPVLRQCYTRRFIKKIVVAPNTVTISGSIHPLEMAVGECPEKTGTRGAFS